MLNNLKINKRSSNLISFHQKTHFICIDWLVEWVPVQLKFWMAPIFVLRTLETMLWWVVSVPFADMHLLPFFVSCGLQAKIETSSKNCEKATRDANELDANEKSKQTGKGLASRFLINAIDSWFFCFVVKIRIELQVERLWAGGFSGMSR